jgi:hypothetical protein
MKRLGCLAAIVVLLCTAAAQTGSQNRTASPGQWQALGTLRNAQYVYVTSYDGPQFSPRLLPGDRTAINAVQNELENSGKFVVVYEPWEADMVMMVMVRGDDNVLSVYDAHNWPSGSYLWRASEKNGLTAPGAPLVKQFEAALERASSG